jgi:hypothetical protein
MVTCGAVAIALVSCLLVPFAHHFSSIAPPSALRSIARAMDCWDAARWALPAGPDMASLLDSQSWQLFNPAALHVRDAPGLGLRADESLPADLQRVVREGRAAGTFYFEGWYYKLVSKASGGNGDGGSSSGIPEPISIALIPGVVLSEKDEYGFVMLAHPGSNATIHKYPLGDVIVRGKAVSDSDFFVRVGPNTFTATSVSVDIPGVVRGAVTFTSVEPLPSSWVYPTVMGWFAYLPGMQCCHGVLSLSHALLGSLTFGSQTTGATDPYCIFPACQYHPSTVGPRATEVGSHSSCGCSYGQQWGTQQQRSGRLQRRLWVHGKGLVSRPIHCTHSARRGGGAPPCKIHTVCLWRILQGGAWMYRHPSL